MMKGKQVVAIGNVIEGTEDLITEQGMQFTTIKCDEYLFSNAAKVDPDVILVFLDDHKICTRLVSRFSKDWHLRDIPIIVVGSVNDSQRLILETTLSCVSFIKELTEPLFLDIVGKFSSSNYVRRLYKNLIRSLA